MTEIKKELQEKYSPTYREMNDFKASKWAVIFWFIVVVGTVVYLIIEGNKL